MMSGMRAARAVEHLPAGALRFGRFFESLAVDRVTLDRFLAVMSFENATL
jgi:hypothetical protein